MHQTMCTMSLAIQCIGKLGCLDFKAHFLGPRCTKGSTVALQKTLWHASLHNFCIIEAKSQQCCTLWRLEFRLSTKRVLDCSGSQSLQSTHCFLPPTQCTQFSRTWTPNRRGILHFRNYLCMMLLPIYQTLAMQAPPLNVSPLGFRFIKVNLYHAVNSQETKCHAGCYTGTNSSIISLCRSEKGTLVI